MTNSPESLEIQIEERKHFFRQEIARITGEEPDSIDIKNIPEFLSGHKFLYFFTATEFGKIAKEDLFKKRLARESHAQTIAAEQGLPNAQITHPYTEIGDDHALFMVEKLSAEKGDLLPDADMVAGLSEEESAQYASAGAKAIFRSSLTPVPSGINVKENVPDFEGWERWVVESRERLEREIDERSAPFLRPETKEALQNLYNTEYRHLGSEDAPFNIENFLQQIASLKEAVEHITSTWPEQSDSYLVHNDAGVQNTYFLKDKNGEITDGYLIDYELATYTNQPMLGLMRNILQFYSKGWSNSAFQKQFLTECYKLGIEGNENNEDYKTSIQTVVKTAAILGALNFALFVVGRAATKLDEHINEGGDLSVEEKAQKLHEILLDDHELSHAMHRMEQLKDNVERLEQTHTSRLSGQ